MPVVGFGGACEGEVVICHACLTATATATATATVGDEDRRA
jgi:hypothetical protein